MKLRLPQYSGKDYQVLGVIFLPLTIILNSAIFGTRYYADWLFFLLATLTTAFSLSVYFAICGGIAVMMKNRFPKAEEARLKLILMIITFVTMSGLFLVLLFRSYESFRYFDYRFNESSFIWAYIIMAIINIFLTLLMEGVARYEIWKQNLKETEQLKEIFKQTQLQGLKSQVNPHFLFNSLNTLSCLIQEDEEKAEKFLNEMTKVYRYMLRSEDEQLVTLETELKFLESYVYLLKARFGDGIQMNINVDVADREKLLPALSLQVLIENAFTQNTISKSSPLVFDISSCNKDNCRFVEVKHNKQAKVITEYIEFETEVDNLVKKYALLNEKPVTIREEASNCCFYLPLINNKEPIAV